MTQKSTVAIVGLGNIGAAVAANLVKGDRPVVVADRKIEKAQELSGKLGSLARPLDIPSALREADIVLLAIYFGSIKEFFTQYAAELDGKVIIDPSNPIAPDDKGGFKKIIGQEESSGELLSALLPKGTKLVKALGTLGAASLSGAAFQNPDRAVLFYATDDTSLNGEIETLITDAGFDPVRAGGLDQSIRLEVFGDLHEFGALGKTVTAAEAKEKV